MDCSSKAGGVDETCIRGCFDHSNRHFRSYNCSYFFHCCSNRRPQKPLSDHCRKFIWLCIVVITWVPLTRSNYSIYTERPIYVKRNRLFTTVYFLLIFFMSAISAIQCCLLRSDTLWRLHNVPQPCSEVPKTKWMMCCVGFTRRPA